MQISRRFRLNSFCENNGIEVVITCIIICVFQSFAFSQENSPFYSATYGWLYLYLKLSLVLYLLLFKSRYFIFNWGVLLLLIALFTNWFLGYIHSYGKENFFTIVRVLIILPFCLLKNEIKAQVYVAFKNVLFLMSLLGIIVYAFYSFNLVAPVSVVEFYDNEYVSITYDYANYVVSYLAVPQIGFARLCGLFNEPGMLGTLGALVLVADRLRIDRKNVVIITACILAFSTAFYAIVFVYILIRGIVERNKNIFFLVCLFLVLLVILTTIDFYDERFAFFFNRFVFDDGDFAGNNRTTEPFELVWNSIINDSEKLWFGLGRYVPPLGSSSYKIFIINHGIFGTIMIFLPFVISALKDCNKHVNSYLLLLVFMISIYQRPQVFSIEYFIVLFGGIQHSNRMFCAKLNR